MQHCIYTELIILSITIHVYCFFRYVVQEDNSLVIRKLLITDNGIYQCFARNEAGENSLSTWLRVKSMYIFVYKRVKEKVSAHVLIIHF